MSVALVDEETMKELNGRYRGVDAPTDVLAFNLEDGGEAGDVDDVIGEVVICVPVAESQARERGASLEEELELLAAHGLLHIAGYTDDTESGAEEMDRAAGELVSGRPVTVDERRRK